MKSEVLAEVLDAIGAKRPVVLATNLQSGQQRLLAPGEGATDQERAHVQTALRLDKPVTTEPDTTVREMEEILLTNNIGHLPIVENGKLAGIITRTDYLAFRRTEKEKVEALRGSLV